MNSPNNRRRASQNGCKVCAPLGACLAICGIEGAVPFLHGSQGCATYIRRYMISHFKEPVDIASSNFEESAAIFGGERNLITGLRNVYNKYHPEMIGIATTCLAETMGEDVNLYLSNRKNEIEELSDTRTFFVSTPSYCHTHAEGFWNTLLALASRFAKTSAKSDHITLFPGMLSPADIRYLKEILSNFGISGHLIPDYSDTLDGPIWSEYLRIPEGGTPFEHIENMGSAAMTIEFTDRLVAADSPADLLKARCGVPSVRMPLPIGITATDRFFDSLTSLTGGDCPEVYKAERARLLDAYVDGHKYVFGATAVLYGEQDMVVAMARFLAEIGVRPVICASGGKSGKLETALESSISDRYFFPEYIEEEADFALIERMSNHLCPDLIIGNSKGYSMSRRLGIPLIRVGFPIHDRFGGQRILHVGYRGAAALFDRIVNSLIEVKQYKNPVGYTYM